MATNGVDGTTGNDTITAGYSDAQGNTVDGADGLNDTVYGNAGNDSIAGGSGNDTLYGDATDGTGGPPNDYAPDYAAVPPGVATGFIQGTGSNDYQLVYFTSATSDTIEQGGNSNPSTGYLSGTATPAFVIGEGDGVESHLHAFSEPVSGLYLNLESLSAYEDVVFWVDGTHLNLNDAVAAGIVTISSTENSWSFDADGNLNASSPTDRITLVIDQPLSEVTIRTLIDPSAPDGTITDGVLYTLAADVMPVEADLGGGKDTISGGIGDDVIYGGENNDSLNGDAGNDTLNGDRGNDAVNGGLGNDSLDGGIGADTLLGGDGNDAIYGGAAGAGTHYDASYAKVHAGDYGTGTGANGAADYSYTNQNYYDGATNGVDGIFVGAWGTTDEIAVTEFSREMAGVNVRFTGFNPPESVRIILDGTAIDLNQAIADGLVTVLGDVGSWSITAAGGLTATDPLETVGVTVNIPFTTFSVDYDGATDTYGVVYDLHVDASPVSAVVSGGNDSLDGGAGNDFLSALDGNDTLLGGIGDDTLVGGQGNDSVLGGDGDDNAVIGACDTVRGEAGDDFFNVDASLLGNSAITLVGGETVEDEGGDVLDLHDKTDVIVTYSTTDPTYNPLTGTSESGTATFTNAAGQTVTINFTEIETVITPPDGIVDGTNSGQLMGAGFVDLQGDAIDGPDGVNDVVMANGGDDTVDAGAGNDTVYGGVGNDLIYGGAGSDVLIADAGNDTLSGGAGADSVYGGSGNAVLIGGAGDWLSGNDGDDLFTVDPTQLAGSNITILGGEAGETASGDVLNLVGMANAAVTYNTSDPTYNPLTGTSESGTATYTDSNGTTQTINFQQIEKVVLTSDGIVTGTSGNDSMSIGYADPLDGDLIDGADGLNDSIVAGLGNDTVDAGFGNDTVYGGAGDDSLAGNEGNDSILGEAGNDTLQGGDGTDSLYGGIGQDSLVGADGNDLLDGGAGNDGFYGGAGDDSILAGTGDNFVEAEIGNDTITADTGNDSIFGGAGNDSVEAGAGNDGVTAGAGDDIVYSDAGNDTVFGDGGNAGETGNDSIFAGQGDDLVYGGLGNDRIETGDGQDTAYGDEGSDTIFGGGVSTLYGGAGNDFLLAQSPASGSAGSLQDGGVGDDQLSGSGLDDTQMGGDGNDALDAGAGNDLLYGGAGNDSLFGLEGNDSVYGGDGADIFYSQPGMGYDDGGADFFDGGAGNDTAFAGSGNDTLVGGAGDDSLRGEGGDDTFTLGFGFGNDAIIGGEWDEVTGDTLDASTFPMGTTLTFTASEAGTLSTGSETATFSEIENVLLGSGNDTVDGSASTGPISVNAGAGNDSVLGSSGNDTLLGGQGADTINGGAGNDLINVGTADYNNDTVVLQDGGGDDTLGGFEAPIDMGSGTLTPRDQLDVSGLTDANGDPVDTADVVVTDDGNGNAVLTFPNGESLTLVGVDPVAADNIDYLVALGIPDARDGIVDGTTGDDSMLPGYTDAQGDSIGAGNDSIVAGAGNDTVDGGAGDDTINSGDGNDSLIGGTGNDSILGGNGGDTLAGGVGNDLIDTGLDNGVPDLVVLADGDGQDTVEHFQAPTFNPDGTLNTAFDQVDVSGLTDATGNPVNTADVVVTDDGNGNAVLTFPNGESLTLVGISPDAADDVPFLVAIGIPDARDGVVDGTTGGDNMLPGYTDAQGDTIGAGNDSIVAGAGNDTVDGGDGADTISAGTGNDSVLGGAGNDSILGSEGSDTVDGGAGDDFINTRTSPGLGVPDTALVHPTDPALSYPADTNPNNDRDSVLGGAGNDTILTGDDADTIYGGTGNDMIDAGFDADLVYSEDGNDSVQGGEGRDTIYGGLGVDVIYGGISPLDPNYTTALGYELTDDIDPDPLNNADSLFGGDGDDEIYGQDDADTIEGGEGNDVLDGGIDDDSLFGGAGHDFLTGGQGADTLVGGAGLDSLILGDPDGVADTIRFSDNDGNDTVLGFEAPVDNGDGTFTGQDQFDVSGLTDADGNPVNASDVLVSDDGYGNAVLTFPNGETMTLIGVAPSQIDSYQELTAAGIPCFVAGTMIETIDGPRPIEELQAGDLVETADHGFQPLRWIGSRTLDERELSENRNLRPIRIQAGALGLGMPERDLYVSPQHRMLAQSKIAMRMFGKFEVLVAAKQLVLLPGVDVVEDATSVEYFHMLFDRHQIVYAEGALSESLYTGPEALLTVGRAAIMEILQILPDLRRLDPDNLPTPARPLIRGRLARKLAFRHSQNELTLLAAPGA